MNDLKHPPLKALLHDHPPLSWHRITGWVKTKRKARQLISRLIVYAACAYLIATCFNYIHSRIDYYWNISHNAITDVNSLSSKQLSGDKRLSDIMCKWREKTCFVQNLYYINESFHLYMGSNFTRSDYLKHESKIYTGIGWGTGFFKFENNVSAQWVTIANALAAQAEDVMGTAVEQISPNANNVSNVDFEAGTNNELSDETEHSYTAKNTRTFTIPIYVHNEEPPNSLSIKYQNEPTLFYSVLWPNLFRTLYAGISGWYTLLSYQMLFENHHSVVLLDKDPKPKEFVALLQYVTPAPVRWMEQIPDTVFKAAVLGVSRDALVAEIVLERGDEWRFKPRAKSFRKFCDALKRKVLTESYHGSLDTWGQGVIERFTELGETLLRRTSLNQKKPRVTLVLRDGNVRKILNEQEVINMLKELPITLSVHRFGSLPFKQQIEVVDKTDIFISMHGAALTHILFLRPGAYVIELFPFQFQKRIYENLAAILGLNYLSWQNERLSSTIFNWNYIEKNRVTDMPKERVTMLPIDWYNMDSKNYWRNQDTFVSKSELKNVIQFAIDDRRDRDNKKFLIYMPWEQLNNQIIGFKSACAVAHILNRTLVLPMVGFRAKQVGAEDDTHFDPKEYVWKSFEAYFDPEPLQELPCRTISYNNFVSLNKGQSVGTLRYHSLGPRTEESQQRAYYKEVLRLKADSFVVDSKMYFQNSRDEVMKLHGADKSRVLALGTMFWYYDFNIRQQFPLTTYYDYLKDGNYSLITSKIQVTGVVKNYAKLALESLHSGVDEVVAIHVRRGDYWKKCVEMDRNPREYNEEEAELMVSRRTVSLQARCLTTTAYIDSVLSELLSPSPKKRALYISTNSDDLGEFQQLHKNPLWHKIIYARDLSATLATHDKFHPLKEQLDDIENALVDQLVCTGSDIFVGNMFSSFTRHIVETRRINGSVKEGRTLLF